MSYWFALIVLLASSTFGCQTWRGIRTWRDRLPVQFLEFDEYERDHTMFIGMVGLNILLSVGLFVLALIIVATGWS